MSTYKVTVEVDEQDVANLQIHGLLDGDGMDEILVVRRYFYDKAIPPYYAAGICEQMAFTLEAAAYLELYDLCQVHDGVHDGDVFMLEHGGCTWPFELSRAWLSDPRGVLDGLQPSAVSEHTRLMQARGKRVEGGSVQLVEPPLATGFRTLRSWLDDEDVWQNVTREEAYCKYDISGVPRYRRLFKVATNDEEQLLVVWEEIEGGQP